MLAYARRNVVMVTSVGAMVVSILLIIFFGAWAVSAGSDTDVGSLAASATSGFAGAPYQPGSAPRLASAGSASAADTWWGKAFLVACPLH